MRRRTTDMVVLFVLLFVGANAYEINELLPLLDEAAREKSQNDVTECFWVILDNAINGTIGLEGPRIPWDVDTEHPRFVYSYEPVPSMITRYNTKVPFWRLESWKRNLASKPIQPFHIQLIKSMKFPFCVVLVIPLASGHSVNQQEVSIEFLYFMHERL